MLFLLLLFYAAAVGFVAAAVVVGFVVGLEFASCILDLISLASISISLDYLSYLFDSFFN